jgi:uncharacterized protein YqhQ
MKNQQGAPRYGGRALRNGVMMVGPTAVAVAVRRPDGKIVTAIEPFSMPGRWSKNMPFVRGIVSFGGMLKLARVASRLESRLNPGGQKWKTNLPQLAPGIGAAMADRLAHEISKRADDRFVAPIETIAGVALPFVAFGVSGQLPGVRELWRYHGAEHKVVHTAEAGLDLTADNARSMSRVHPRCGTVMAFWGLLGGMLVRVHLEALPNGRRKKITGAVAGPLILASAYEAVRLGARLKDHPAGKAFFGPAWQTQRLTTAEPDDQELEVACAALQAVVDHDKVRATGV